MITADEARALAEQFLPEIKVKAGRRLALWDGQFGRVGVEDHGDVWTVAWNSVEYLESGNIFQQILSGPIVVPKDGSELFILGTWSRSIDEMLAKRRADGSPSDSAAVALASRVVSGLRTYFGLAARGFSISDVREDHNLIAFSIGFELYDFYTVIFNYDRGFYGFGISFGDRGVEVLRADDVPGSIADIAGIAAELDRRIRLRIPDKYLEQYVPPPRHLDEHASRRSRGGAMTPEELAEALIALGIDADVARVPFPEIREGDDRAAWDYHVVHRADGRFSVEGPDERSNKTTVEYWRGEPAVFSTAGEARSVIFELVKRKEETYRLSKRTGREADG